jgi:hypothetical protein
MQIVLEEMCYCSDLDKRCVNFKHLTLKKWHFPTKTIVLGFYMGSSLFGSMIFIKKKTKKKMHEKRIHIQTKTHPPQPYPKSSKNRGGIISSCT